MLKSPANKKSSNSWRDWRRKRRVFVHCKIKWQMLKRNDWEK